MDNAVTQAVLMWSAAFLLGTVGVLILWFGLFLFFPPSVNNWNERSGEITRNMGNRNTYKVNKPLAGNLG